MDPGQHYPVTDLPALDSVGYCLMGTFLRILPVLQNSKECPLVTMGSLQSQDPRQLAKQRWRGLPLKELGSTGKFADVRNWIFRE
ncbi:proline-rich receptor-like protein kinase PERK2 [Pyrus ussuriensis x Pyrus communis]|uniref:Proline-rich receptor-like protein kinase PERK2 n=1 Tax=Pyrus ussuriensis x Pyrus communis TaxID=2448454 RepID=A0A5N5GIS7_9ROSA|nr:proline-rich receptor-like protein kinase PERK2 [Pyrus ussuriensis x Pyrus communis]